ncbi:TolC family protein [Dyadobacter fermentans]|uniref:Outer membrane efflux protein n=1 Tax=Dyadobacter fermentans (strain ATCC 700827 / DSM 18053 / CIP 107007 / KCTC 52180 / NS114) TaxID=471854 RepID=C6W0A9_DYAFD|nr:TolC family protein [Dyadobacter fermentans]ACT91843.1 outer membrane efflux protein [Dyadobacter fermentans DSM 18053]
MRFYLIGLLVCASVFVQAQDTLKVTVRQADSLFLKNNLTLLAERYQIDIAKAAEIQDKLWDNPNLSIELSAYNPSRGWLDVGRGGQKFISLQQVITRAGKRTKQVALDVETTRKTELEFFDLARTLKFDLRQLFFETHFLGQTLQLLDNQIATLATTVEAFDREYGRNNVSLKEVVRLKALLFQLRNNRADILFEITENQRDLRIYFNSEAYVVPVVDSLEMARYRLEKQTPGDLRELALLRRTDLKVAESAVKQAELNYNLQKALAKPNIEVGAVYDQASNYQFHYFGLSASMNLPFFNRNQGNIRAAKSGISYFKTRETAKRNSIANEVNAAWNKVTIAENAFRSVETRFSDQFSQLNRGMYDNFQKRNITLLEFIDFIETYNESIREFNRLQADRIKVYEELNFVVGEELFGL